MTRVEIIAAYVSGALHHIEAVDLLTRGATRSVKVARAIKTLRDALMEQRGDELEIKK